MEKKYKHLLFFMGFFLLGSLLSCQKWETNAMKGELTNAELSGIWIMEDGEKMANFLKITPKLKGGYCMDLNFKGGKAKIQFLYSDKVYDVNISRVEGNKVKVYLGNKFRIASVRKDNISPIYYWHFQDSSPYDPHTGSRDGTKISRFKNLTEAVKAEQERHEFFSKVPPGPFPGFPDFDAETKAALKKVKKK